MPWPAISYWAMWSLLTGSMLWQMHHDGVLTFGLGVFVAAFAALVNWTVWLSVFHDEDAPAAEPTLEAEPVVAQRWVADGHRLELVRGELADALPLDGDDPDAAIDDDDEYDDEDTEPGFEMPIGQLSAGYRPPTIVVREQAGAPVERAPRSLVTRGEVYPVIDMDEE